MKKEITFQEFYKFPLKLDSYVNDIVWTENNERAFDFSEENILSDCLRKSFVDFINTDVLNGSTKDFKILVKHFIYENSYIWYINNNNIAKEFLSIRGWGGLTGGLNLSEEKARKIQDDFGQYITNKLNNVLNGKK